MHKRIIYIRYYTRASRRALNLRLQARGGVSKYELRQLPAKAEHTVRERIYKREKKTTTYRQLEKTLGGLGNVHILQQTSKRVRVCIKFGITLILLR